VIFDYREKYFVSRSALMRSDTVGFALNSVGLGLYRFGSSRALRKYLGDIAEMSGELRDNVFGFRTNLVQRASRSNQSAVENRGASIDYIIKLSNP
jgi:hypothetical protein